MRADRLVATLLLMQARGRVTAGELAVELEVSVATARRDLEALSTAGVPVYPQPGRGGGWTLLGGTRTDLTGLTAPEARALFLLLGPASSTAPQARSALRKIMGALPETFRAEAEAARDAVARDPLPWGGEVAQRSPVVANLQDAVVRRRQARLVYGGEHPDRTVRLVDPWGLVEKSGTWYLLAGTGQGRRTFRVDRITEATTLDTPAIRPDVFDLPAEWEQVVEEMEQRRSLISATVLVPQELLPVLRRQFGRHCQLLGAGGQDHPSVRVAAHTATSIAETLAGFGASVEVLEPTEVRDRLAAIGSELVASYAVR